MAMPSWPMSSSPRDPADGLMRVIVELVGDPAPPRIEATGRDTGSRLPKDTRDNAQLGGEVARPAKGA